MSTQSNSPELDDSDNAVVEEEATRKGLVVPEGFDPAALHLLRLRYENLFNPYGGGTHPTDWQCKGCGEIVTTVNREPHYTAHKRLAKGGTKNMANAKGKLTAIQAIVKVLTDAGQPMKMPEIIEKAVPLTALKGKFPGQTLYSVAYSHVKKPDSLIEKTGNKGEFKLARPSKSSKATVEEVTPKRSSAKSTSTPRKASSARSASKKKTATAKKTAAQANPHPKPNARKRRTARRTSRA